LRCAMVESRSGKERGSGMPGEVLLALAQWAGQTVAAATVTDVWESSRRRLALLLGRGNPRKTEAAERWLEQTHQQLTAVEGADLEAATAVQAQRWETRFADLLDEDPDVEPGLRALIEEIHAQLSAKTVTAAGHSLAAGNDLSVGGSVNIADRGGVVARDVYGPISVNPPLPGPAKG
jgi:hypothetical protein